MTAAKGQFVCRFRRGDSQCSPLLNTPVNYSCSNPYSCSKPLNLHGFWSTECIEQQLHFSLHSRWLWITVVSSSLEVIVTHFRRSHMVCKFHPTYSRASSCCCCSYWLMTNRISISSEVTLVSRLIVINVFIRQGGGSWRQVFIPQHTEIRGKVVTTTAYYSCWRWHWSILCHYNFLFLSSFLNNTAGWMGLPPLLCHCQHVCAPFNSSSTSSSS